MDSKQPWWILSSERVCQFFTDPRIGLSEEEAAILLHLFGANTLKERQDISAWRLFLNQFFHLIVGILIAAGSIAALLGSWVDAGTIFAIVLVNGIIGFVQEYGAERSLVALRNMTKPQAKVIREGKDRIVSSSVLVPGDIVVLNVGDVVPADGRIIESRSLSIDESALTGESVPDIKQHAPLPEGHSEVSDRANMAFMDTLVVKGGGTLVVTETGAATQFGEIAAYVAQAGEPETQLQKQLTHVGYALMSMAILIGVVIVAVGLLQGVPLIALLFTALSLFIAAVPEGLPAVITIALARAVKHMAARHVLIRRLASVEGLGSISVICADKTGTLTQNRMMVQKIYAGGTIYEIIRENAQGDLLEALRIGVLCNGASLDHDGTLKGDPTEGALLSGAAQAGIGKEDLEARYPLVKEYPFDSERMLMSMLRKTSHGYKLFLKGASDRVLDLSTKISFEGFVRPITDKDRATIRARHDEYARQALRIIAVAYREGTWEEFVGSEDDEKELTFVGLFAMIDPPRKEVTKSLQLARQAGIRTLMLTGDHKETARAIAILVGLMHEDEEVLTGAELDTLSDEELLKALYTVPVYARISVAHKIRIVEVLKRAGERVAMTGDGVNDAPALKAATIGIAMGIMGTDVAKEASDMIITDDNYASIINAIEEGRGMYESLVKFVRYLLSSNLAEILVVLWGGLANVLLTAEQPLVALLPIQLLWINLVSDGLPAIALVFDPLHEGLMDKKPSDFSATLMTLKGLAHLVGVGIILSLGVMGAYFYGLTYSAETAQTLAFTTLVLLEFVRLASVRSEYKLSFFSNYLVILAMVGSLSLQVLVIYMPALQKIFRTVPLLAVQWLVMAVIVLGTWLVYKAFRKIAP